MKFNMRKVIVFAGFLFLLLGCNFTIKGQKVYAQASAKEYATSLENGYNLGNTFESGMEDTVLKDEAAVRQMLTNIKSQGFTSLRIPITWTGHFNTETYAIEPDYIEQIGLVVRLAVEEGFPVVITMYNDSFEWICDTSDFDATLARFQGVWLQIGTYFKDYSDLVSFEAVNTPYFKDKTQKQQLKLLKKLNKGFVTTIRSIGGGNTGRVLFVPTLNSMITEEACKSMAALIKDMQDPLVAVSVEYYGPWNFSVNAANELKWNKAILESVKDTFELLEKYFTQKDTAVIMSEFGLYGYGQGKDGVNHGQVLKYFENVTYLANKNQVPMFLWDTGNLYNWVTNTWKDADFEQLLKQARTGRSAYCTEDSIYCALDKEQSDVEIKMALHGFSVTSLVVEGRELVYDTDYLVNGNVLTIRGSLLSSFLIKGEGQVGSIQVNYSEGCPWTLKVYGYGQPLLDSAASTEEGMSIKTAFAGNRLATMESVYDGGAAAGTLAWTTYQEYGYSFYADYENSTIKLTKEFLNSLEEGKVVTLVFHFESGLTYHYTMKKEAGVVKEANYSEQSTSITGLEGDAAKGTGEAGQQNAVEQEAVQTEADDTKVQNVFKQGVSSAKGTMSIDMRMILTIIMFVTAVGTIYLWFHYRKKRKEEKNIYFVEDD